MEVLCSNLWLLGLGLLRREIGKLPENQEKEIIIFQKSTSNIPEKKKLRLRLSRMIYGGYKM